MLCKYKSILGKEKTGFHKTRFFGVALWDTVGTVVIAIILSVICKISFAWTLVSLVVLGIFLHRLFCVNTTINKIIFGVV
jgi:hypothetical protein